MLLGEFAFGSCLFSKKLHEAHVEIQGSLYASAFVFPFRRLTPEAAAWERCVFSSVLCIKMPSVNLLTKATRILNVLL